MKILLPETKLEAFQHLRKNHWDVLRNPVHRQFVMF